MDAAFQDDVDHDLLGKIARGTISTEYYWLDRWYNVFRFAGENGSVRNFYCNVNVPPVLEGDVLSYIDLDIDLLVQPDFSYQILDLDDFERNAEKFSYPTEIRDNSNRAIDELISLIEARDFPFHHQ